jgi:hypothetical protein
MSPIFIHIYDSSGVLRNAATAPAIVQKQVSKKGLY